jgi:uncharacterized protein (DUF697 family)
VIPETEIAVPASQPPPWFRGVVWDSLLGASCQLLPLPVVDDLALLGVRRRMLGRVAASWGLTFTPAQLGLLAGGARRWTVGRLASKVVIYPIKKVFRKVFYFLAVMEATDTFSHLFHQGYLLHTGLGRGALGGEGQPTDEQVARLGAAVRETLAGVDTRPLRRVFVGVLRNSRRLVAATLAWMRAQLGGRGRALEQLEEVGVEEARLAAGSPEAEQLLDRLLPVLWGEEGYRRRLEQELAARLLSPSP